MGVPTRAAITRLNKDYSTLLEEPIPYVVAVQPLESNILEWHYVVLGAPDTPYAGGYYHGKLVFPDDFPFRPPAIYMITPSGRFETNKRLCLSISDFHPDTWNPSWRVSTILTGLISFMNEQARTFGSIKASEEERRRLARHSRQFNLHDEKFCELFSELAEQLRTELADEGVMLSPLRSNRSRTGLADDSSSFAKKLLFVSSIVLAGFAIGYIIRRHNCRNQYH